MLLLEKLAASPRDSLTYYAFAEDNNPAGPRRTETDLRYVDIRPFKREYKMGESGNADIEGEGESTSLAELIARQRFNLNRAKRLAKHKPADKTFVDDPLKIAGFEETLVEMTRELTEGFEGIVGERIEPLHAAEESMLAALAALDHGQNERAPDHMGDALRHLIQARNTLRVTIGQDAAIGAAMRGFDRAADPEDPQAEERPGRGRGDRRANRTTCPGRRHRLHDLGRRHDGATSGRGPRRGEEAKTDDEKTDGEPKKDKRREATERQVQIAEKLRDLEEKLKKLEVASDLAKARMANAAETAEKASGRWPAATRTRRPRPPRRQQPSSTSWPGRSRASSLAKSRPSSRWPATWPMNWPSARPSSARCRAKLPRRAPAPATRTARTLRARAAEAWEAVAAGAT